MRVLVACEFSGVVRDAFAALGHDAWSCDLIPSETPGNHVTGDVLNILEDGWDLMIAHPPCTYLSRAGARWWHIPERQQKADEAFAFVMQLWNAPIKHVAIENPIGQINRRWRYPDQTIQPYQYGCPFSKATCLWLRNIPLLTPTKVLTEYWPLMPSNTGWGARSGQKSSLGAGVSRKESTVTFTGIAQAMATQWGAI